MSVLQKKFEPRDLNLDHVHPKDKGEKRTGKRCDIMH